MAEERASSRTALGVAALRAVHQVMDAAPRILEDPVITRMMDAHLFEKIQNEPGVFQTPGARGLRAHVILRSRFAEDKLAEAVERGVAQYVVLGAGLDTFAYRQPAWAGALRVFEVDHPASQESKRERLHAAGIAPPPNLVFAPVDFEIQTLADGLRLAGFDRDKPAFFSWLGVTMYLTEAAIDAVLAFVGSLAPGSGLVLTFAQPETPRTDGQPSLADRAAEVGEPWITRFTLEELEHKLRGAGFAEVGFLMPDEAVARYFQDRADDLPPPRRVNTAFART
ncbi:MAG TPA: class I SAM-dependent methyltransferase [Holophagaceae bacterium]|nr:class I SAM-dependent methyltransferase [Holophagaceae bacterium]